MKNQKLRELIKKSNLLGELEDFNLIEVKQSKALRGGGDGICDNKGPVEIKIVIVIGLPDPKPINDGCDPKVPNKVCC